MSTAQEIQSYLPLVPLTLIVVVQCLSLAASWRLGCLARSLYSADLLGLALGLGALQLMWMYGPPKRRPKNASTATVSVTFCIEASSACLRVYFGNWTQQHVVEVGPETKHASACTFFCDQCSALCAMLVVIYCQLQQMSVLPKLYVSTLSVLVHASHAALDPSVPNVHIGTLISLLLGFAIGFAMNIARDPKWVNFQPIELSGGQFRRRNGSQDSSVNALLSDTRVIQDRCGLADELIDLVQSELAGGGEQFRESLAQLAHAKNLLSEAQWWSQHGDVFFELQTGSYRTRRTECCVGRMLEQRLGIDGEVDSTAGTVHVDTLVLRIAVEEVLASARTHRLPSTPIEVSAYVEPNASSSGMQLHVRISNSARAALIGNHETDPLASAALMAAPQANQASAFRSGPGFSSGQQAVSAVGGELRVSSIVRDGWEYAVADIVVPCEAVQPARAESTNAPSVSDGRPTRRSVAKNASAAAV